MDAPLYKVAEVYVETSEDIQRILNTFSLSLHGKTVSSQISGTPIRFFAENHRMELGYIKKDDSITLYVRPKTYFPYASGKEKIYKIERFVSQASRRIAFEFADVLDTREQTSA